MSFDGEGVSAFSCDGIRDFMPVSFSIQALSGGRTGNKGKMTSNSAQSGQTVSDHDWGGDLVRVARERDVDGFEMLFRHFAPRIRAFLMRGGASPGQAEELAQETLLAVWRKAHLFDPDRGQASTWIFTLARNLRIDRIRKERRPEPDFEDPSLLPDPPQLSDRILEGRQDAKRVREAMMALPDEQRSLVRMSFFNSLSHNEIAERLNIPLGTVKSRLRLAIAKLRNALEELA